MIEAMGKSPCGEVFSKNWDGRWFHFWPTTFITFGHLRGLVSVRSHDSVIYTQPLGGLPLDTDPQNGHDQ